MVNLVGECVFRPGGELRSKPEGDDVMQGKGATIYSRYGLWYVSFAEGTSVAPVHITGPFKTQRQAEQIVHVVAFTQRVAH